MNVRLGKRMRVNLRFRRRTPPGTTPGTVKTDPKADRPVIRVISYVCGIRFFNRRIRKGLVFHKTKNRVHLISIDI